jgi:hypothetical protein
MVTSKPTEEIALFSVAGLPDIPINVMTFFYSETVSVPVTSFSVEHVIQGYLSLCSWSTVTHIWLSINYFCISFKPVFILHQHQASHFAVTASLMPYPILFVTLCPEVLT